MARDEKDRRGRNLKSRIDFHGCCTEQLLSRDEGKNEEDGLGHPLFFAHQEIFQPINDFSNLLVFMIIHNIFKI